MREVEEGEVEGRGGGEREEKEEWEGMDGQGGGEGEQERVGKKGKGECKKREGGHEATLIADKGVARIYRVRRQCV